MRAWFLRWSGNDWGAGQGGAAWEARNLRAVADALRVEGVAVEVFGATSKKAFLGGATDLGRWRLGSGRHSIRQASCCFRLRLLR